MTERPQEARRHRRAPMLGTAIVVLEGAPGQVVAIENLSAGGALVCAEKPIEPGTWVHVLLCLPGTAAASLLARVVRNEPSLDATWRVALQFDRVPPLVEEALRHRVAHILERQDAARVESRRGLVVGPDNADRGSMVIELRRIGFSVLVVDTVPEAVQFLGQQPSPFEFIAVDAVSECAEGVDLLAMARRIYPALRCILIGDAADPDYLERECKFLERSDLLLRPWTPDDLRRVVSLGRPGESRRPVS